MSRNLSLNYVSISWLWNMNLLTRGSQSWTGCGSSFSISHCDSKPRCCEIEFRLNLSRGLTYDSYLLRYLDSYSNEFNVCRILAATYWLLSHEWQIELWLHWDIVIYSSDDNWLMRLHFNYNHPLLTFCAKHKTQRPSQCIWKAVHSTGWRTHTPRRAMIKKTTG